MKKGVKANDVFSFGSGNSVSNLCRLEELGNIMFVQYIYMAKHTVQIYIHFCALPSHYICRNGPITWMARENSSVREIQRSGQTISSRRCWFAVRIREMRSSKTRKVRNGHNALTRMQKFGDFMSSIPHISLDNIEMG